MKAILCTLLATAALAVTASAAPRVVIDTLVRDSDAPAKSQVLAHLHFLTRSGKQTKTRVGAFEYALTPTLRDNGTVDLSEVVTHYYDNRKPYQFGPYRRNTALGDSTELALGGTYFTTRASIVK